MQMGGIDTLFTRQLAKRKKRKRRYEMYIKLNTGSSIEADASVQGFIANQSAVDPETSNDIDPETSSDNSQGTDLFSDDQHLSDNLESDVCEKRRNLKCG